MGGYSHRIGNVSQDDLVATNLFVQRLHQKLNDYLLGRIRKIIVSFLGIINKEGLVLEMGSTKDCAYKIIWMILPILFFLFSDVSAQQKPIRSENAEFYKSRGLACLEKRRYNEALFYFNRALRMNPGDAYAHYHRGRAYGEQGQYDLAISDCTEALKTNPRFGDAYFYRGLIYHNEGQYGHAISDYTKALEINPEDAGTYYARAVAYYFKKEYEESRADIKKAQSLGYPIDPKSLDDLSMLRGK